MSLFEKLPYEIQNDIYKIYFSKFVLSNLNKIDINKWMWYCTKRRKTINIERGSIQLGYTLNDSWSRVYISCDSRTIQLHQCNQCVFKEKACNYCINLQRNLIR